MKKCNALNISVAEDLWLHHLLVSPVYLCNVQLIVSDILIKVYDITSQEKYFSILVAPPPPNNIGCFLNQIKLSKPIVHTSPNNTLMGHVKFAKAKNYITLWLTLYHVCWPTVNNSAYLPWQGHSNGTILENVGKYLLMFQKWCACLCQQHNGWGIYSDVYCAKIAASSDACMQLWPLPEAVCQSAGWVYTVLVLLGVLEGCTRWQ